LVLNVSKYKITEECWARDLITVYVKTPEKLPISQAVSRIGKKNRCLLLF